MKKVIIVLGFPILKNGNVNIGERGKKRHHRQWKMHEQRHEGKKVEGLLEKEQAVKFSGECRLHKK